MYSYKTPFNADSVEWCPHEPTLHVFVCANYQLQESQSEGASHRIGCILLFAVNPSSLTLLQTIDTAGVLDQKWCHRPISGHSILGIVNANNTLELYSFDQALLKLRLLTRYVLYNVGDVLLLSLDWSTGKYNVEEPEIVCSDSKGQVHHFKLVNDELVNVGTRMAHEFEAWIAAFYYWNPNIFFTGGDDCNFLKFDQRAGLEPIMRNRTHEAGVTSIHSNSMKEHIVATGSYDTKIRLWDVRFLKSCTNAIEAAGTLWRLKWHPSQHNFLLAACMLGGVQIVSAADVLSITYSVNQHKSLTYGVDWSHTPQDQDGYQIISSCSFYDNLLCISKIQIK